MVHDDDYNMEDVSSACKPKQLATVAAPLPSELVHDGSSSLILALWDSTTKPADVASFLARWPPSRNTYASWIAADRGPHPTPATPQDVEGLTRDWAVLKERAAAEAQSQGNVQRNGTEQGPGAQGMVTVEALDALAEAHGVLTGKWMIYAQPHQVDDLWSRIVTAVVANAPLGIGGRAKVSPARPEEPHVVCVYVEDYSDGAEVGRVRDALRRAGVRWRIGFKPDVYTHLGIYKGNEWMIRPSRYLA
ncbi:putative chromosome 11 open reading frame 68 [Lyophyllum shimeji]|uniref:Chromosome 11 open reading frame 68 n=1 Tax=Lyophyllum shimeji TaxID=47721 RepID=A0A9P3PSQ2_LYOSH|nr:putative chromosome 11 open reading frame 68 [Lyophyllum shimeji]